MFCYQCEQTTKGEGCVTAGVCGIQSPASELRDLLIHAIKGVSYYAHRARQLESKDREIDVFVVEALFSTITNVNFDQQRLQQLLTKSAQMHDRAKRLYEEAAANNPEELSSAFAFQLASDPEGRFAQAREVEIPRLKEQWGDDITGLISLVTYGLMGLAAYADHALILGKEDDAVYAFIHETLALLTRDDLDVNTLLGQALKVGEVNLKVMGMLDAANTETYGHPEPTAARITPLKGKAILISGHDLKDLEELLKQTEGKGINVYTHGEMLPALSYPGLKKYSHLVGNYGGAWQDQQREFDEFPGAILMTTNCIQKPRDSYANRIFTCGLVAWPGIKHIDKSDFSPVIEAALAAPGFTEDAPEKTITIGFGRNAVLNAAGKVVELVKGGKIRHFFLIGGCDGAKHGRNYYTELAEAVPQDCVIMTLACGKYRFNKLDFGDIDGIPRLLDIGQCNDAYSAIQIAAALAEAFETDVNGLPLSLILSWYEQKAVVILLSLLHLGIKNIKLGPSLPAFVTPAALNILVENYNIAPISSVTDDLNEVLGLTPA